MENWQLLGIVGSIVAVMLFFVMMGVGRTLLTGKDKGQQEEGAKVMQMTALGDVECCGDECQREETCFGCPPEGPDVALDQDPNRFLGDPDLTD